MSLITSGHFYLGETGHYYLGLTLRLYQGRAVSTINDFFTQYPQAAFFRKLLPAALKTNLQEKLIIHHVANTGNVYLIKVNIMSKNTTSSVRTPMTPAAASRVQSSIAQANGGQVPKGSFAARAQSAAAGNTGSKK